MRYLLTLTLLVFVSCSPNPSKVSPPTDNPKSDLPLQTDKTVCKAVYLSGEGIYKQYGFTLQAEFINTSEQTVYFENCLPDSPTPMYVVNLISSGASAYNVPWACVGHDKHVAVAPDETFEVSLKIQGPNSWDGITKEPYGVLEGRFQLVFKTFCKDDTEACPLKDLTPNTFEVLLER